MNFRPQGRRKIADAIGLHFRSIPAGNYSVNMVLQAVNCCGKDTEIGDWSASTGALMLSDSVQYSDQQTSTGLVGQLGDAGLGIHKQKTFGGVQTVLDLAPKIVGFVFRDGRLHTYINGAKVNMVSVYSNARSSFQWINGWLDEEIESRGQLAEIKVYSKAFDDATMIHLQSLLDCKWHVATAQTPDWAGCKLAKGNEEDEGGGSYKGPLRIQAMDFATAPPGFGAASWAYGEGNLVTKTTGQPDSLQPTDSLITFDGRIMLAIWADDGDGPNDDDLVISGTGITVQTVPYSQASGMFGPYNVPGAVLVLAAISAGSPGTINITRREESFSMPAQTASPELWLSDESGTQPTVPAGFKQFFSDSYITGSQMQDTLPHRKYEYMETVGMRATKLIRTTQQVEYQLPITIKVPSVPEMPGLKFKINGADASGDVAVLVKFTGEYVADSSTLLSGKKQMDAEQPNAKIVGKNGREADISLLLNPTYVYHPETDAAVLYKVNQSAAKIPGCMNCKQTATTHQVRPVPNYSSASTADITMAGVSGSYPTVVDAIIAARGLGQVYFFLEGSGTGDTGWTASMTAEAESAATYNDQVEQGEPIPSSADLVQHVLPITFNNIARYGIGTGQRGCNSTGPGCPCNNAQPTKPWNGYHSKPWTTCFDGPTGDTSGVVEQNNDDSNAELIVTKHTQAIEVTAKMVDKL